MSLPPPSVPHAVPLSWAGLGCSEERAAPHAPTKGVLRLTLTKKWFDLIASGEKKEEYRMPGKWILSRLEGKTYDRIEFKNGYGANVPTMEVEYLGWSIGFGQIQWGAGFDELIVIRLGRVLSLHSAVALPTASK